MTASGLPQALLLTLEGLWDPIKDGEQKALTLP